MRKSARQVKERASERARDRDTYQGCRS
jgi:hypothetical protein